MQKHRKYWREATDWLIEASFNGNMDDYENYFEKTIVVVEPVMERYSKLGNEFWLKTGNERALFQTMEDTMLVNPQIYEKELSKFLGREFKYDSICLDDPKLAKKKVEALRKEVLAVCKAKYPDLFEKYSAFKNKQRATEKVKVANAKQEAVDLKFLNLE